MDVNSLSGELLDYWVARAEAESIPDEMERSPSGDISLVRMGLHGESWAALWRHPNFRFRPSSDWAQGGPIIERERIRLVPGADEWVADHMSDAGTFIGVDAASLVAAMRAYVASQFGGEVPDT